MAQQDGSEESPYLIPDSPEDDHVLVVSSDNEDSDHNNLFDDDDVFNQSSQRFTELNCPIYEVPPKKYHTETLIKILLNPKINVNKICKERPLNIEKSCTFVISLKSLKDQDDVKKDNFGVWHHSGSHQLTFECYITINGEVRVGRSVNDPKDVQWEKYSLRKLYSKHPTNEAFKRLICFLTDSKGVTHDLCLLVYHIPKGFVPTVLPHGNSKTSKPFYPTWPSTMKMIKAEMAHSGPKDVVATVSGKVGGVLHASAPGELPRGERQVINAKTSQLKFKDNHGIVDDLFVIMQKAKVGDCYIRDVKASPDPAVIVASDQQLNDVVRFCASNTGNECSIMTVDPTFCLGEFECTPTTYRHLLVVSRRYKTPPIFLGPVLIHYRKNFPSFLFFASSLVAAKKDLQCLKAFGTDGEESLAEAFSHEFRFATHLYCFIHVRNNIKKNLRERKFSENDVQEILSDIFGKQVCSTYCEGLVDAESEEVFYQQLEEKRFHWEKREEENAACNKGFYNWFCQYQSKKFTTGMLRNVREDVGLGVPPSAFSTNASESINAMLKRKVNYKKNELPAFVKCLKEIIDEQQRELERAVVGRGKYQFREDYQYLEICENDWFRMTTQQKEKHLHKIFNMQLKSTDNDIDLHVSENSKSCSLSISAEQFYSDGLKIPLDSIRGIWRKAEELLNQQDAIVSAPGFENGSKMVISRGGKRPHLVKVGKGGRISCDSECPNWKALAICSHCVAVAQTNNNLEEFVDRYRKAKHLPSITQLLLTGLPSAGIGKKGNRVTRKRKHVEVDSRISVSSAGDAGPFVSPGPGPSAQSFVSPGPGPSAQSFVSPGPGPSAQSFVSPGPGPSAQSFVSPGPGPSAQSFVSPGPGPSAQSFVSPGPGPSAQSFVSPGPGPSAQSFVSPGPGPSAQSFVSPGPGPSAQSFVSPGPGPSAQSFVSPGPGPSAQSFVSPYLHVYGHANGGPTEHQFRLCFRRGNISVCSGCRNKFNKAAQPPHDLCVQHEEWRSYTSPSTNLPESRFGNAYYHPNLSCIQSKWPTFFPGDLIINNDVNSHLQMEHKSLLLSNFGICL